MPFLKKNKIKTIPMQHKIKRRAWKGSIAETQKICAVERNKYLPTTKT
jgi:hypothetical protein